MFNKYADMGRVDLIDLTDTYKELLKIQERIIIKAAIAAQKQKIKNRNKALKSRLEKLGEEMATFTSSTLTANLAEGFEGKAADSASSYLHNLPQLTLESPVKSL